VTALGRLQAQEPNPSCGFFLHPPSHKLFLLNSPIQPAWLTKKLLQEKKKKTEMSSG
jgi:hypothetical protein